MQNETINIFDFLRFKNSKRTYGKPEVLEDEILKMPVTLTTDNGKDLVVYLLVKSLESDVNRVSTLSESPYEEISVVDNEIVCQRFDSKEPVRYDMNGRRITADSKLTLRELD